MNVKKKQQITMYKCLLDVSKCVRLCAQNDIEECRQRHLVRDNSELRPSNCVSVSISKMVIMKQC